MYSIFGIINPTNDGCKIMLCTIRIMYVYSIYVTAQFATADRFRNRPAGFESVDPLRIRRPASKLARVLLARRSIEQYYHAPFYTSACEL